MNRDEKLARVTGLPPKKATLGECEAIFPSEPSGGTWIGVNDCGITLALINWYSVERRVWQKPLSRGGVVRSLLGLSSLEQITFAIGDQPLSRINPFRLICVSTEKRIIEYRWDLKQLQRFEHPWLTRTWISSGFDEPGAQRVRGNAFAEALQQLNANTSQWLRQLHSSHRPSPSPYSTCMHRTDAATVSYTEIETDDQNVALRHVNGSPCLSAPLEEYTIHRRIARPRFAQTPGP